MCLCLRVSSRAVWEVFGIELSLFVMSAGEILFVLKGEGLAEQLSDTIIF